MAELLLDGISIPVQPGTLLCEALGHHRAPAMPCAGKGRCGKCRVVATGALSEPSAEELAHLSADELAHHVRLACCCKVQGNCAVERIFAGESVICTEGEMPEFVYTPQFKAYGAAVDLGTTTLAARLYGAQGLLAQASAPNPQASFGADVISRIEQALHGKGEALASAIRGALGALLAQLAAKAGIDICKIDRVVVTGNTTMLYLFTLRCPHSLSHAPFAADHLFGETLPAEALGLSGLCADVYLPRCISAFIGADITTALLASGLCARGETALLADIGTNGELALWHQGQLTCCSTATGPAFEGAGVSMGMPGKTGAVDHVSLRGGALCAHVIGEAPPAGLCGSGIIDAVACLLQQDTLDESGFLEGAPDVIAAPVTLTQADVRAVQLAKSAVCSGIRALLHTARLAAGDIAELAVAGGFGSYLDIGNAARIGLLPAELAAKTRVLGNAALAGACMLLLDETACMRADALARGAKTLELSQDPYFIEQYTENMLF